MIYILIGRDDNTGDEWVRAEMFFDASLAVADCQRLNNTINNATYRIETAENHVERKAKIDGVYNGANKLAVNAAYGKYADTDSLHTTRTEDFQLTELFPVMLDGFTGDNCTECGVTVEGRNQRTHTIWHNKLLP